MTAPRPNSHWLLTDEPHRIGSGWLSGTIGAVLGLAALSAAGSLRWPQLLTTPGLRQHLPPWLATAALATAVLAFALGVVSLLLRRKKTLGAIAVGSAVAALPVLAGAPDASITHAGGAAGLGLDVFCVQLIVYSALFVPLERLWPRRDQPTFRPEWWTDLAWFASSALLVQVTTFLVLTPGLQLAAALPSWWREQLAAWPLPVQFVAIVVVSDLVQYWVHRASHTLPWLWRFHAIHHGAEVMDWLAGSRLHVVDAVLTRALVFAALMSLGFAPAAIGIYLVFVAAQATFVHANVCWRLHWLEPWLVTPRFHHWHHASSVQNVNFAVHLPWLDRLFGSHHLPAHEWPEHYGLADGQRGPRGSWRQLLTLPASRTR
jgi:lathosterol oxidase